MTNRYFDADMLTILLNVRRWRLVGSEDSDSVPLALPRHRRWMESRQHAHSFPEIMVALSGTTAYGMSNRIYLCRPGSVFVFAPNQTHDEGYPPWTPPLRHLWITCVQDKAIARILTVRRGRIRAGGNLHCLIDLSDSEVWRQTPAGMPVPEFPPELQRMRLLTALANLIIALAEEGYRENMTDQRRRFQHDKIDAICRHIRETGGADASLDHLARIAGYSKFHFLRLFRHHTGQTVHAHVNQARQRKIKTLLARGLPLKAISAELGFSCPAAFSRWYRPFRR